MNEMFCNLVRVSLKFVPEGPIDIGSGNGLVPNGRQAINSSNTDPVFWRIYAVLGGDKLID